MSMFFPKAFASRQGTVQTVAVGTSSAAVTNPFGVQTYQVLITINSTSQCFVLIGDGTPTATTSSTYIPSNFPVYFAVSPGQKVAVIGSAANGNMFVTELW